MRLLRSRMTPPLVSCIMPTYNRRRFVPRAVEYFFRQDYEKAELIIVDDGTDPIEDLIPRDRRIRYVRLAEKTTIGEKRNLACGLARGEIIVHWDDDDWMADWRLSYQAGHLGQADICGLSRVFFFDPAQEAAWEYIYPGTVKRWVSGATLCYRKSFWEENPFPKRNVGEDLRFIWRDPDATITALPNNTFIAELVHADNAGAKRTHEDCWSPVPFRDLMSLIGADFAFYASLNSGVSPA